MTEEFTGPAKSAEDLFDPGKKPEPEFLDKRRRSNDPGTLKEQALSDKAKELQQDGDLRAVLATQEGIRLVSRIVEICGWNLPYFHASNSVMCEVAGRRSIAYQIEQWISNADLKLWFNVRSELEKVRPKPATSEKAKKQPARAI